MRAMPTWDRAFRLVLGVLILGLYGALPVPWRYLTLAGLVPLGSALTGFCARALLRQLMGIGVSAAAVLVWWVGPLALARRRFCRKDF
jgi:hypothetical protein